VFAALSTSCSRPPSLVAAPAARLLTWHLISCGRCLRAALLAFVAFNVCPVAALGQPVRSLLEIRQEGVIVQKWETSCAAAALATVLTFTHNDPVSEKLVAQRMLRSTDPIKVKVRGGFSLLDMKRFVETRGLKGTGFKGLSFDELLTLQSPIVPIETNGNPHFVVVRGLTSNGQAHLADPAFGNHTVSVAEFVGVWKEGVAFAVSQ
jgi:uncharacterized protein